MLFFYSQKDCATFFCMGRKKIHMKGTRWGRLKVIEEAGRRGGKEYLWRCRCDCGNEKIASGYHLRSAAVTSCGCRRREEGRKRGLANSKHGHSAGGTLSRTYRTWRNMIQRCTDPNATGYDNYGGRGIAVCDSWRESIDNFIADMGIRPPNCSIDRIDPNGNYTKDNCRWATSSQQMVTRRNTVFLEHGGERLTLKAWSVRLGVPYATLYGRLSKGWPTDKVLSAENFRRKQS